jgi:hypothetical protein
MHESEDLKASPDGVKSLSPKPFQVLSCLCVTCGLFPEKSHHFLQHVISINLLASSAGAAQAVQMNTSLFLVLPSWQRWEGAGHRVLCDDSGVFPDAKCIIPLALQGLPSKSLTTVCYRIEQSVTQK